MPVNDVAKQIVSAFRLWPSTDEPITPDVISKRDEYNALKDKAVFADMPMDLRKNKSLSPVTEEKV